MSKLCRPGNVIFFTIEILLLQMKNAVFPNILFSVTISRSSGTKGMFISYFKIESPMAATASDKVFVSNDEMVECLLNSLKHTYTT